MLRTAVTAVRLAALVVAGVLAPAPGGPQTAEPVLLSAVSALDGRGAAPEPHPHRRDESRRRRPDHAAAAGNGAADDASPNGVKLFGDYTTPPRTHTTRRVVVHYVTTGPSAPPLNDDDADGVPDYVERVGEAADTAVDYFARRGFVAIRPDDGGPDAKPDIYVSRCAAGTFGVALPEADAEGGAFAVVANRLDPSRDDALGSLDGTVAHELFHLVQFAYFGERDVVLPDWVLEGTAAAMERRLHPGIVDIVSTLQLRRWFAAPHRSITTQSYGAQLLWATLDRRHPRLLPTYLARLAAGRVRGDGAAELVSLYARATGRPFAPVFHDLALAVAADHGAAVRPVRMLSTGVVRDAVERLAVHYVRLRPRRGGGATTVRLASGDPALRATLVYELESETAGEPSVIVRARRRVLGEGSVVFRIPESARRSARFARPLVVLSNGAGTRAAPYRLIVS